MNCLRSCVGCQETLLITVVIANRTQFMTAQNSEKKYTEIYSFHTCPSFLFWRAQRLSATDVHLRNIESSQKENLRNETNTQRHRRERS